MALRIDEKQMKTLIKNTLREEIKNEFIKMRAFLTPDVSDEEQLEVERLYGKPSKKISQIYNVNF